MFPLFFGSADEPLYGVCHPAEPTAGPPLGAVICPPILHECDDAHRALRALAELLARAGVHVLRFDYRGTGDSAGNGDQGSVPGWTRDVRLAMDELRASRGVESVGLVGLRFGASLAARAAAEAATEGEELPFVVLWEPVVRGGPYVQSLRSLQAAWLAYDARERPGALRLGTPHEVMGNPLPDALGESLGSVDLLADPLPRAARSLIVDEGAADELAQLASRYDLDGLAVEHERIDGGTVWRREFDAEQAQVPRPLLSRVVDWVTREQRA